MCKMLLSINPEHVENILNGNKQFEFRKIQCKSDVDKIVIYSTSPVMRVVGEAEVLDVLVDTPDKVWQMTAELAGITKDFFDKYFENKKKAVAYRLGKVQKYQKPLELSDFGINFAPQSFVYI
ncbi:MAG: ASCH domain-containing protein [Peptococcaceae bacterium]|nr:ASCH domain-containing protein [Peptococcaceae bacterium]